MADGVAGEPLASVRHVVAAGLLSLATCKKPSLLLLPRPQELRGDRHAYSPLRISGFPGAEVERKMARAWLVVGHGSVDIGLRFSVTANQSPCTVCTKASSRSRSSGDHDFCICARCRKRWSLREGLWGSGMIDSIIESSGAESLVTRF
jgi:endogenous inhibitor of DNA gyrase (YacG/DUF329 family)